MSEAIEALLARSRAPGAFVERRRFTLSRERAIEKQRAFALRHPQQYILELVQAAVLAEAGFIAVDVGYEHVTLAWVGGRCATLAQLGALFDHLFADRGQAEGRHLIQLAVGLNGLLQRRPLHVLVESGDGLTAARMEVDARGEVRLGQPETALAGTLIHVRRAGSLLQRMRDVKVFPEQALIEERCLYTPVPILVNGHAPFGYHASRHLAPWPGHAQLPFDLGERWGVLALPRVAGPSPGFKMVLGGTWVCTLDLPELGEVRVPGPEGRWVSQPLFGVIADDTLRKTADQSDVVRDRRFHEMIRALRPLARQLAGRRPGGEAGAIPVLAQAHTLSMATLAGRPPPTLWVSPQELAAVERAADPARLPAEVLILREVEAEELAEAQPGLGLLRLSRPADVDLHVARLERARRLIEDEHEVAGGWLRVALHLEGPSPGWGQGEGLPALVEHGGRALRTGRVALPLPGLSLRLRLEAEEPPPWPALRGPALAGAARLLDRAPPEHPASRALLAALVDHLGRLWRVEEGGADGLRLALPPTWSEALVARAEALVAPALRPSGAGEGGLGAALRALGLPRRAADAEAAAPGDPPRAPHPAALRALWEGDAEAAGVFGLRRVQLPGLEGALGLSVAGPDGVWVWTPDGPEEVQALAALPLKGLLMGAPDAAAASAPGLEALALLASLPEHLGGPHGARALALARARVEGARPGDALALSLARATGIPAPGLRAPPDPGARLIRVLARALSASLEAPPTLRCRPAAGGRGWRAAPLRWHVDPGERALTLVIHEDHPQLVALRAQAEGPTLLLLEAGRLLARAGAEAGMFHVEHGALIERLLAEDLLSRGD